METNMAAISAVQEMKRQHEARLLSMSNVVAIGVGFKISGDLQTTEPSIVVSVVKKLPTIQLSESALVPKTLGGVKTDVIETGKIFALQDPTQKMRPARPGISIGHYQITAGTLGCLVQRNGQVFILSNNHVLANSNAGQLGDAILSYSRVPMMVARAPIRSVRWNSLFRSALMEAEALRHLPAVRHWPS